MKLSAIILTKDESDFLLKPCLESVYSLADEIIIVDSNGKDSLEIQKWFGEDKKIKCFVKKWLDSYSYTDSRNFGIEQATGDWTLHLDADEVLGEKKYKIRDCINRNEADAVSLVGHHFMYNLSLEDATLERHIWRNRLTRKISYPKGTMHGLPQGQREEIIEEPIIFHFGYVKGIYKYMRDKWRTEKVRWEMHSPEQYRKYILDVLNGKYPVKPFMEELPIEIERDLI